MLCEQKYDYAVIVTITALITNPCDSDCVCELLYIYVKVGV